MNIVTNTDMIHGGMTISVGSGATKLIVDQVADAAENRLQPSNNALREGEKRAEERYLKATLPGRLVLTCDPGDQSWAEKEKEADDKGEQAPVICVHVCCHNKGQNRYNVFGDCKVVLT
ncbi:MAG: hypothetical protein ACK4UN_16685 [Limisphaerales bacterium]